jgi:hypothetical protein
VIPLQLAEWKREVGQLLGHGPVKLIWISVVGLPGDDDCLYLRGVRCTLSRYGVSLVDVRG